METSTTDKRVRKKHEFQHLDRQNPSDSTLVDFISDVIKDFKIQRVPRDEIKAKVLRIKRGGCKHVHLGYLKGKINQCQESICTNDEAPHTNLNNDQACNGTISSPSTSGTQQPNVQNLQQVETKAASHNTVKNVIKKVKKKSSKFPPYMPMTNLRKGLDSRQLAVGTIRINAKNSREAYVSNEDGSQQDYFIKNLVDRNRALEGDMVAIKVNDPSDWTEKLKTATVVNILEKIHPRITVGVLKPPIEGYKDYAFLIPRDSRMPRLKIPLNVCPAVFRQNPKRCENMLFKAKIFNWNDVKYPVGELLENIGCLGDLESERDAILVENALDTTPFPSDILSEVCFDEISPQEMDLREDLTNDCIFTIDPATARDLDDAVSCKELADGNLEIGVHISDVTHFLKDGSKLDKLVSKKATSIYLVNEVFHMLPRELCLHCSLLPGENKRAFSVIWTMTPQGDIISYRFTKTVIKSCVQLSYEHAQSMIEDPNYEFKLDELPKIHGKFTYKDLSKTVNYLQKIAVRLRKHRFDSGSLRIDQTKLLFKLEPETGKPIDFFVYENKEAHRLIEEFMLLANIFVAQKIKTTFPTLAFLRNHDSPNQHMIKELVNTLKPFNIDLDVSSSKSIQAFLTKIRDDPTFGKAGLMAIYHLLTKPMRRALYYCSFTARNSESFEHYALHVPIYTHFTSPIRRYADIMVHRLLAASLGYQHKPKWSPAYVTQIANNCNVQKQNAKLAGDASSELYLAQYVASHQPFIQDAIVVDLKSTSFELLVYGLGTVLRIFSKNLDKGIHYMEEDLGNEKRHLLVYAEAEELPEQVYEIELFSILKVNLTRKQKTNKLEAKLLRPIKSETFCHTLSS